MLEPLPRTCRNSRRRQGQHLRIVALVFLASCAGRTTSPEAHDAASDVALPDDASDPTPIGTVDTGTAGPSTSIDASGTWDGNPAGADAALDGEVVDVAEASVCSDCGADTPLCLGGVCFACFPAQLGRRCSNNTPQFCNSMGRWQDAPTGSCSGQNPTCSNGSCICDAPNLDSDPANCGRCGRSCFGHRCSQGAC